MGRTYFQSDGNGGYVVSKDLAAWIGVIITILVVLSSVVAYGVSARAQSDYTKVVAEELKTEFKGLDSRVDRNEVDIAVVMNQYEEINRKLDKVLEKG